MRRTVAAVLGLVLLAPLAALARPGGGQSYAGGGQASEPAYAPAEAPSYAPTYAPAYEPTPAAAEPAPVESAGTSTPAWTSEPSTYDGPGPTGILWLLLLMIRGMLWLFGGLFALVVGSAIVGMIFGKPRETWDSSAGPRPPVEPDAPVDGMAAIRGGDPDFSQVLFEDFLHALYVRVHRARGDAAALDGLAPYLEPAARESLGRLEPVGATISGVVVGSLTIEHVAAEGPDRRSVVIVGFESNLTATLPDGISGHYMRERWSITRAAGVRSRPPAAALAFRCPSCGAPFIKGDADGRCGHCGQLSGEGRFDWSVRTIQLVEHQQRPPTLGAHAIEVGTDSPSVVHPGLAAARAALEAADPDVALDRLEPRLHAIYREINAGWNAGDMRRARPFLSDGMFDHFSYWLDAYRSQGLSNALEAATIRRCEIVKLVRDRFFDAITVRVWATGLDYTMRVADDIRIAGSATEPRAYSEYWTLIRGATMRGAPRATVNCPSCGADLERITMAGNCEHCGTHLTRGEFDWVLSKIEQDESYRG